MTMLRKPACQLLSRRRRYEKKTDVRIDSEVFEVR